MSSRRATAAGPLAAFVLHSYDWSETSLIVDLFTRERGRVVVAAKGAKRPYSQFRALLMPFQRLTVQLGRTPADEANEVHALRSAEWAGGAAVGGGPALVAGFYLNELLLKLLPRQDAHAQLFDAYAETLPALAGVTAPQRETALRGFELLLLRELGWLPELTSVTVTAQPVSKDLRYALHPEAGVVEATAAGLLGSAWLALEEALMRRDLPALRQVIGPTGAALRQPLRDLLHYHLGSSQLRTREVMRSVRRLIDTEAP